MCGISVARGTPATSAASAGASVRMSLTTTCGRISPNSGSSARAASAAWPPSGESGSGTLDGGAPLLPGLDRHLVSASGQCSAQGYGGEDVPRVTEGCDQEPHVVSTACPSPRRVG